MTCSGELVVRFAHVVRSSPSACLHPASCALCNVSNTDTFYFFVIGSFARQSSAAGPAGSNSGGGSTSPFAFALPATDNGANHGHGNGNSSVTPPGTGHGFGSPPGSGHGKIAASGHGGGMNSNGNNVNGTAFGGFPSPPRTGDLDAHPQVHQHAHGNAHGIPLSHARSLKHGGGGDDRFSTFTHHPQHQQHFHSGHSLSPPHTHVGTPEHDMKREFDLDQEMDRDLDMENDAGSGTESTHGSPESSGVSVGGDVHVFGYAGPGRRPTLSVHTPWGVGVGAGGVNVPSAATGGSGQFAAMGMLM